jgi:glyoxylase-like metal-dependent hydrolase (beta-lactamase superfamily II)
VNKRELDFWTDRGTENYPEPTKGFYKQVESTVGPYVAAGRVKTFEGSTELFPGIHSLPACGHTPGHTYYVLEDGGEKLVFMGDTIHAPDAQFDEPDITIEFDVDQEAASPDFFMPITTRQSPEAALARRGGLKQPPASPEQRSEHSRHTRPRARRRQRIHFGLRHPVRQPRESHFSANPRLGRARSRGAALFQRLRLLVGRSRAIKIILGADDYDAETAALHDGHRNPPQSRRPWRMHSRREDSRTEDPGSLTVVDRFPTFRLRPAAFLEIFGFVKRAVLRIQLRERLCLGGVDCEMR